MIESPRRNSLLMKRSLLFACILDSFCPFRSVQTSFTFSSNKFKWRSNALILPSNFLLFLQFTRTCELVLIALTNTESGPCSRSSVRFADMLKLATSILLRFVQVLLGWSSFFCFFLFLFSLTFLMLGNSASTSFPFSCLLARFLFSKVVAFNQHKPREAPTKKKLTCPTFHKFAQFFSHWLRHISIDVPEPVWPGKLKFCSTDMDH